MNIAPTVTQRKYAAGCIVSTDPIVAVSKREAGLAGGLASLRPELFEAKPSLHFIGLTWSVESAATVDKIAMELAQMRSRLPLARFVMMANTPLESIAFARAGVATILANELIFIDERLFTPAPPSAGRALKYDAAYTARLAPGKRHELAKAVPRLVLMYAAPQPGEIERVKRILPHAVFANHELNGGVYRYFDEKHVRDVLIQSAVGLCLSDIEGAMRASLEYRFCGLPVVSTHSLGGRDRYLLGPHVRIVEDDAQEIANAVAQLKSRAFDPIAVRDFVGRLVAFDRHNFLMNANKVVERELGARDLFRSFEPFLRYPIAWRPLGELFAPLEETRQ